MKVVTIEIVTSCQTAAEAENVVLDLLERERRETDAEHLSTWQVTRVADHYSLQAKGYRL